jgi:glycerol-3-phosphate dehydrogenase (NAD(P)+)
LEAFGLLRRTGVELPERLSPEADLAAVAQASYYHLVVIPSEHFRGFLSRLQGELPETYRLIWATKGIEHQTGKLLHEVIEDELGEDTPYAIVSGPTFAAEVAREMPTAMSVAAHDSTLRQDVAALFHGLNLRMYTSDDVTGVELGGAIKNVLAIAAGISDGLQFGANARAALITRGLAETMRLSAAMGANQETLMGLTGLGDLVLTCTDDQSRNRRFGLALGRGKDADQAMDEIGQVVEGAVTAKSAMKLMASAEVEMPICALVYRILYENLSPESAVQALLNRSLKAEY